MFAFFGAVITALRERASALVVGVSLALVAVATGFISYTHISALTVVLGGSWKTAHLMPLAVDGQIAIGSVILMEVKDRRRWLGLLGFVPGLLESLFANWESGIVHGLLAAGWSTVPAQAFACSTFLFELWLRYRRMQAKAAKTAAPHSELTSLLGWPAAQLSGPVLQAPEPPAPGPEPALVHVHAAPEGTPWGLVSPAAVPEPEAVPVPVIPTYGPVMALAQRPKPARAPRPKAVPDAGDERKPLPDDEDKLRVLVNSMGRNDLVARYQVTKHRADKLREQYLDQEEVA